MNEIDKKIIDVENYIKKETDNDPDIVFKKILFFEYNIMLVFMESLVSRDIIDNFILEYLEEKQISGKKGMKELLPFLKNNIPTHKSIDITTYNELFYNLYSGYTILLVDEETSAIAYETKLSLNSNISPAISETVIKGPQDAFTENYQINIGLIKRRIKSNKLRIDELKVGKLSQTKVAVIYVDGIAKKDLVDIVKKKIEQINIDAVMDSNYIVEFITENQKNVFPDYISTERPDNVSIKLLDGRIAILVENSRLVVLMPARFAELFHSPEDYYQKVINVNYTRIIRFIAFLITILTPAIYVALTTYNHEAIPSKLLINFSVQRDGVPFPTYIEALLMLITFEILKETDIRIPSVIGSSLSIVGALVLGQAAVTAGIVSPIMVIVIALTSISGFIVSYVDGINGLRWWRIIFLLLAATAGILGITAAGLLFIINISSMKSLGVPFLTPVTPTIKKDWGNSLFLTNKKRFFKRHSFMVDNNVTKGKE